MYGIKTAIKNLSLFLSVLILILLSPYYSTHIQSSANASMAQATNELLEESPRLRLRQLKAHSNLLFVLSGHEGGGAQSRGPA